MQSLSAIFFLTFLSLASLLPLATPAALLRSNPTNDPGVKSAPTIPSILLRAPPPMNPHDPGVKAPITAPFGPDTALNVRVYTYDSCEMHVNSRVYLQLQPNRCWDATPKPVFNMQRGFGSFKADYNGDIHPGFECAIVVYDNPQCEAKVNATSQVFLIGLENKGECFNVELGEGVKGFGVEWKCGKPPKY